MEKAAALLLIDLQADPLSAYPSVLLERINRRIAQAHQRGALIVYISNQGRKNKQPYVSALAPGLAVVSPHRLIKRAPSAFADGALLSLLQTHHIRFVELAGIDGNACFAATALPVWALPCAARWRASG